MTETTNHLRRIRTGQSALWSLLCIVFLSAFFPVWKNLVLAWTQNDNYSFGFVIVPLTIFLLWQRRSVLMLTAGKGQWTGLFVLIVSIVFYIFALAAEIQTLASLCMILSLAGMIWFFWGLRTLAAAFLPLFFLSLMIPVPAQSLAALTIPLQLLVSKTAGSLAGVFGVPVFLQGNLILIPNQIFEVVEACSGLRSIMTLVTLGVFLSALALDNPWKKGLLIASALPIAIVSNVIRVLCMLLFSYFLSIDLSRDEAHTFLGLGVFALALGLFFCVLKLLEKWQLQPAKK